MLKRVELIKLLSWCVLLGSITAYAGGKEVGNGGTTVVCRNADGSILSAELLDFYEARTLRGIDIDLGGPGIGWNGKVNLELDRLQESDRDRAELYSERVERFFSETAMLSGVALTSIPDSYDIAIPVGCRLEQVAIQRDPLFPGDKRYFINQDLWNALSDDGKAGLVMHEIIYREAIAGGASDSIASRYFNSLLASGRFSAISFWDQYDLYMDLDFQTMRLRGPEAQAKLAWIVGSTRDDQGIIHAKEVGSTPDQQSTAPSHFLPLEIDSEGHVYAVGGTGPISFERQSGKPVTCAASGEKLIRFHSDGTLGGCELAEKLSLPGVRGGLELNAGDTVEFDDSGNPESIQFSPPRLLSFQGNQRWVAHADLDDPSLSAGTLFFVNDETLQAGGQPMDFKKSLPVRFYAGDLVNTGYLAHEILIPFSGKRLLATSTWTRPGIPWQSRSYLIQFDLDGRLAAVMLGEQETLSVTPGTSCIFQAGTILHFENNGSILEQDPPPGFEIGEGCSSLQSTN